MIVCVYRYVQVVLPTLVEGYRASTRDTGSGATDVDLDVKSSFYEIISNDEDILKILVQVMSGMSGCAALLQKELLEWDKYKHLWEVRVILCR